MRISGKFGRRLWVTPDQEDQGQGCLCPEEDVWELVFFVRIILNYIFYNVYAGLQDQGRNLLPKISVYFQQKKYDVFSLTTGYNLRYRMLYGVFFSL